MISKRSVKTKKKLFYPSLILPGFPQHPFTPIVVRLDKLTSDIIALADITKQTPLSGNSKALIFALKTQSEL